LSLKSRIKITYFDSCLIPSGNNSTIMKFSIFSALALSFAASAVVADVVILDSELNAAWSIFDPMGRADMAGDEQCERVYGDAIHATLPYMNGVSVECVPGSDGCQSLHAPFYGGVERWLVTQIVIPNDASEARALRAVRSPRSGLPNPTAGQCPGPYDTPAAIKRSLGVQFYTQDRRQMSSLPKWFGRMDAAMGGISTSYGVYTTCLKVPLFCKNMAPESFAGWTGITYENRPLRPEDCEGPLDFYIDSIKVSAKCPFHVDDNGEDLDPSFCIDRGEGSRSFTEDDDDYRGACKDAPNKPLLNVASALRK